MGKKIHHLRVIYISIPPIRFKNSVFVGLSEGRVIFHVDTQMSTIAGLLAEERRVGGVNQSSNALPFPLSCSLHTGWRRTSEVGAAVSDDNWKTTGHSKHSSPLWAGWTLFLWVKGVKYHQHFFPPRQVRNSFGLPGSSQEQQIWIVYKQAFKHALCLIVICMIWL